MNHQEEEKILAEFGKLLVDYCFETPFNEIEFYKNPELRKHDQNKIFIEFFNSLDESQTKKYKAIQEGLMKTVLCNFLQLFMENDQFKIIYEKGEKTVDLNSISPSLLGEPIFNDGWINTFSKNATKNYF